MHRRPNLFRRFQFWRARRAMEKRIARLTEAERAEIIEKSPLEAAAFQGEGYHVFRKGVKDMNAAYVDTIGEVYPRDAEDWIIARWLEEQDQNQSHGLPGS